jgi:hypothetical protein
MNWHGKTASAAAPTRSICADSDHRFFGTGESTMAVKWRRQVGFLTVRGTREYAMVNNRTATNLNNPDAYDRALEWAKSQDEGKRQR